MRMPTIRHLWTTYKCAVLQEGLGITQRSHAQVLAQNDLLWVTSAAPRPCDRLRASAQQIEEKG